MGMLPGKICGVAIMPFQGLFIIVVICERFFLLHTTWSPYIFYVQIFHEFS